jgi:hypothetical protein
MFFGVACWLLSKSLWATEYSHYPKYQPNPFVYFALLVTLAIMVIIINPFILTLVKVKLIKKWMDGWMKEKFVFWIAYCNQILFELSYKCNYICFLNAVSNP